MVCSLRKAPDECRPENFLKLSGEELKKLEEKCYFFSEYINQFYDCLSVIIEEIETLYKLYIIKE